VISRTSKEIWMHGALVENKATSAMPATVSAGNSSRRAHEH
jgi:hypothetical protein